ncbi:MAG: sigma-70 family RNA polymerase sigma factor [Bacteroidota bacterium]
MDSQKIYQKYGQEVYFLILKKVKDQSTAKDIFQSTFLKVHKNIHQLKTEQKSRAWVFQICRNEIANYFNERVVNNYTLSSPASNEEHAHVDICCFDRFINDLPDLNKEVIVLTYVTGKKQEEVADILQMSIANVKARIRRSKALLKKRFLECCKYEMNTKGKLIGTPNCSVCH